MSRNDTTRETGTNLRAGRLSAAPSSSSPRKPLAGSNGAVCAEFIRVVKAQTEGGFSLNVELVGYHSGDLTFTGGEVAAIAECEVKEKPWQNAIDGGVEQISRQ